MEGSFDQDLLVFERKEPRNVHKKPSHMSSVAGGVRRRLQDSIQHRRSVRLSGFDQGRDIPQDVQPTPIKEVRSEAELKVEHRRQQLEKWKVEKAQKKKEEAMQKKKPFVAGIPHAPLYMVPLPPPKPVPSTSGRVTRSTTRNATEKAKQVPKAQNKVETQPFTKSFAPKNATFKPPALKNAITLPPYTLNQNKPKIMIHFNPVIHPTRSHANTSSAASSSKSSSMLNDDKPKRKFVKTPMKFPKHMTSSSSDSDQSSMANFKRNIQNRGLPRKPQFSAQSSSDTDRSSSSKADAKLTKKVASKPLPRLQATMSEPILPLRESPKLQRRPIRAAKLKALESIEQQRANMNKIKTVLIQVKEQSPQVVIEPLAVERTTNLRHSVSKEALPKRKSLSSRNCTPKRPIPKSESSSEERIRLATPKDGSPSMLDSSGSAVNLSPFVCVARGKDNARKEMVQKAREGLLGAELEAEEDSVSYFRQLLDSEVQKITLACDRWDAINEEVELPEFVQGLVLSAVGQGRLLMAQKFRQFVSLIERCAGAEGTVETVTVTDLRGFWDMIYLQVKNIDHRFAELEELRAQNWSLELHQSQQRPASARDPAKRPGDPAKKKPGGGGRKARVAAGPSKIREMIAAARKAKQQQNSSTSSASSSATFTIQDEEKTFEAGFFSVRSPIRSPIRSPATPAANRSLLRSVLSSEARKAGGSCSKNTSNAMLRASILGKNVQIEGVSPLEQTPKPIAINLNATPARSILKSDKKQTNKKSAKKSVKTVLFDENESDDGILDRNLTTVASTDLTNRELNKENIINLSSTESVEIIDSAKKSTDNVKYTRKSDGKATENASAKKSEEKSGDTVESTKRSDKKPGSAKSTGKKGKLVRQDATASTPVMTRRQRQSLQPYLVDDLTPESSILKELISLPNSTSMLDVAKDNPNLRRSKRLTQQDEDLIQFDSPVKIVARRRSKRRAVN